MSLYCRDIKSAEIIALKIRIKFLRCTAGSNLIVISCTKVSCVRGAHVTALLN